MLRNFGDVRNALSMLSLSNWQVSMLGEEARPLSLLPERFLPGKKITSALYDLGFFGMFDDMIADASLH